DGVPNRVCVGYAGSGATNRQTRDEERLCHRALWLEFGGYRTCLCPQHVRVWFLESRSWDNGSRKLSCSKQDHCHLVSEKRACPGNRNLQLGNKHWRDCSAPDRPLHRRINGMGVGVHPHRGDRLDLVALLVSII